MPRVVHFEIGCDDVDRAVDFYKTVFGWEIYKWDGPVVYWLTKSGKRDEPGIDGALMKRGEGMDPVVNTMDVPDLDEFIAKVEANGGMIIAPKMTIPGVGWFAYFRDTEGNQFGMMQNDPEAK